LLGIVRGASTMARCDWRCRAFSEACAEPDANVGYPARMSSIRFLSLALVMFGFVASAVAQDEAVVKKQTDTTVTRPITSMRHVGARTRPAMPVPVQAVPASVRTRSAARTMRALPIHFRR
jgi:hypothetical protein